MKKQLISLVFLFSLGAAMHANIIENVEDDIMAVDPEVADVSIDMPDIPFGAPETEVEMEEIEAMPTQEGGSDIEMAEIDVE